MKAAFVVDCSLAMAWLFKDERTVHTQDLLARLDSEAALVPSFWYLEVANCLYVAESKGRITAADGTTFITEISKLEIKADTKSAKRAFGHVLPLSRTHHLTAYDAMYLDLAIRSGLPLATLDEPLRKAAAACGVPLLGK